MRSKKNKVTVEYDISLDLTRDDVQAMKRRPLEMGDEEYLEFLGTASRAMPQSDLRNRKGPRGERFEL